MSTATATAPGRFRDALGVGEFRVLLAANALSIAGSVVAAVALTVLVFERTASPLLASLTFTLAFVPYLVGGALLSGLVDRLPPRRLMVGCDLVSAGIVTAMAALALPVWALLGLLFCVGLLAPAQSGSRAALLPEILPAGGYVPGRSLLRLTAQATQLGGNAVGGLLVAALTPRGALLVNAVGFVASALVVWRGTRRRPARGGGQGPSLARDSLAGARDVLALPAVRRLLLLGWLVPTCVVAPEALAAPSVDRLGLGAAAVGWWLLALPLGTIAGELLGVWVIPPAWRARLSAPLAALAFVPLLGFAFDPGLPLALALMLACGLCSAYTLGLDVLLLERTPPALLARAFTVNSAGLMALQGLGFALAGALAELVPPYAAIVLLALCGIGVAVAFRPRGARA